jgi:hypothetical protein
MIDAHGNTIDPADIKAYRNGWRAWENGAIDALERADIRRVSQAWYFGFYDAGASVAEHMKYKSLECSYALDTNSRPSLEPQYPGHVPCQCSTCNTIRNA